MYSFTGNSRKDVILECLLSGHGLAHVVKCITSASNFTGTSLWEVYYTSLKWCVRIKVSLLGIHVHQEEPSLRIFSWKRNTFGPSVNVGSMFSILQSEEMRFISPEKKVFCIFLACVQNGLAGFFSSLFEYLFTKWSVLWFLTYMFRSSWWMVCWLEWSSEIVCRMLKFHTLLRCPATNPTLRNNFPEVQWVSLAM